MTISIPNELKTEMNKLDEINWSGFIRNKVIEQINKAKLKESIASKIDLDIQEGQFWADKLREGRKERAKELKAEGLI